MGNDGVEYHPHPSGDVRFPGHFTVNGIRASEQYADGYSKGFKAGMKAQEELKDADKQS